MDTDRKESVKLQGNLLFEGRSYTDTLSWLIKKSAFTGWAGGEKTGREILNAYAVEKWSTVRPKAHRHPKLFIFIFQQLCVLPSTSVLPAQTPVTSVCPLLWPVRVNTPFLCGSDLWHGFWLCIASPNLMSDQTSREREKKCQVLLTARNPYCSAWLLSKPHKEAIFKQRSGKYSLWYSWLLLRKRKVLCHCC